MVDQVHDDGPDTDPEEMAEEEGGSGIPMTASEIVADGEDDNEDDDDADDMDGNVDDDDEEVDEDATDSTPA
jgi:hypothetical protein